MTSSSSSSPAPRTTTSPGSAAASRSTWAGRSSSRPAWPGSASASVPRTPLRASATSTACSARPTSSCTRSSAAGRPGAPRASAPARAGGPAMTPAPGAGRPGVVPPSGVAVPVLPQRAGHPALGLRAVLHPRRPARRRRARRRPSSRRARSWPTTCRSGPLRRRPTRDDDPSRPDVPATPEARPFPRPRRSTEPPVLLVEEPGRSRGARPSRPTPRSSSPTATPGTALFRQRDAAPRGGRSTAASRCPTTARTTRDRSCCTRRRHQRRARPLPRPLDPHGQCRDRRRSAAVAASRPSESVFSGTLAAFASEHSGYATGRFTWNPSDDAGDARASASGLSVQDVPAASGKSASFGFTWRTEDA